MSSSKSAQLCQSLGIEVPLIQAPIGSASCPELAAAVSISGALGTLAVSWRTVRESQDAVVATRRLTQSPFAVNVVLEWPQSERVRACLESGADIVSTFWGDPTPFVALARGYDAVCIHSVGSVDEAKLALDAGVDVLVAQGVEAGGHVRGTAPLEELLAGLLEVAGTVP
ncbi:MAG: nitronate monooxygenase, partial [Acidobacteriota bacterium]